MKKIEFGYNNSETPDNTYYEPGISPETNLTEADYYGTINIEEDSYIVAKVVEDKYNSYPNLLDNFIVKPAIADLRGNGIGTIFIDQEETEISKQIERFLNNPKLKEKIHDTESLLKCSIGSTKAPKAFEYLTMEDKFRVVSINHEIFERRNEALKTYANRTFSDLSEELLEKENNYII